MLAGGTSLNARDWDEPFEVIDLQAVGLDAIRVAGETIEIGAMVRISGLASHSDIPALLRDLSRREGPNTLRNAATVGGTIAVGDPESELIAGFLVFGGAVTLASIDGGTRTVGLDELLADPAVLEGAIITSLAVETGGVTAAERTGRTPADVSIVAAIGRKTPTGTKLALTGVASTPISVEPGDGANLAPPGDFRGSSEYRRHLAETLTHRVISQLEEPS